jgi:hypothetical protein
MVAISCLIVIKNPAAIIGVCVLLGFGLIITLVYMPAFFNALKFRKKYKNIIENGTKVQGYIVDYSIKTSTFTGRHRQDYSVSVTYIDPYTRKQKQVSTPALTFNPIQDLGDTSCTVYILNESFCVQS